MATRLVRSGMGWLNRAWHRLRRRPAQAPHSLLLLRLENVEVLSNHLGKAGFGHLASTLSDRLGRAMRPDDPIQMSEPAYFAVALIGRTEADAMQVARRLQVCAQDPVAVNGVTVTPVLTGVLVHADGRDASTDVAALLEGARRRMLDVAPDRLGQVILFDHAADPSATDLQPTVASAARAGQIVAHFQPQVCCDTGRVTGFEALARWDHPTRGLLPPAAFLPRMSDADHRALTLAMLRQAIAALKCWDSLGWQVPTVSVNISNCELSDAGFATSLLWELDRQNLRPDRLVLEVLENVAPVTSSPEARDNLARLTQAGCRLDLDDFGTGYASLDAIRQFGIHRIKIDRSFVMGCDIDPGQQRMILAILALAERLGIAALAEGVETPDEHGFLAQMGCDEVQGFAIARPMPLEATLDFLAAQDRIADGLPGLARRDAS